jgi:hypothetical protein
MGGIHHRFAAWPVTDMGQSRALRVVLDANAVGVDPPLGKIEHRLLLDAHRAGTIVLVIPELSLREAVNRWKELVQQQSSKLANARQELLKLAPSHRLPFSLMDRERGAQELLAQLSEALTRAGVPMPKIPHVTHDELVGRALDRRQPFDARGSGYRDALLWKTVCDLESQGCKLVLVSNDPAAFAEGRKEGGQLAASLAGELSELGSVSLFEDLGTAIKDLGLIEPEALKATSAAIERMGAGFPDLLLDELAETLIHPVHIG